MTIQARYSGVCRECGERWQPGTHGPLIDLPDQTCPDCGLEHPGADCQQPDLFEGAS